MSILYEPGAMGNHKIVKKMRTSEYEKLYGLRNYETGKLILYYWASSQKHKALFSTMEKAFEAADWIDAIVEIVEFK